MLKEWNLYVKEDKVEFTHVYLTYKGELLKPDGKPLVDGEDWRTNKTLGSLHCSTKDIHRFYLGYVAFNNLKKFGYKDQQYL